MGHQKESIVSKHERKSSASRKGPLSHWRTERIARLSRADIFLSAPRHYARSGVERAMRAPVLPCICRSRSPSPSCRKEPQSGATVWMPAADAIHRWIARQALERGLRLQDGPRPSCRPWQRSASSSCSLLLHRPKSCPRPTVCKKPTGEKAGWAFGCL